MFRLYCPVVNYNEETIEGYVVSMDGRIRSLSRLKAGKNKSMIQTNGRIITPFVKRGTAYTRVSFSINGKSKKYYVHTVVALAFPWICGKYFKGAEVDHKNGKGGDNRAENLWWCTHSQNFNNPNTRENALEKSLKNILKAMTDESRIKAKLAREKAVICVETGEKFSSRFQAAESMNINPDSIWKICKGLHKRTRSGYSFEYCEPF